MKKLMLVLLFSVILVVGAFAEHPGGWGIGIVGQSSLDWKGFDNSWGAALSLKAPQWPIYLGINGRIRTDYFGLSLTGDYYIIDQTIVPNVNFGWYFGLGGYAGFYHVGEDIDYNGLALGARMPIGIYIIPVRFFEIFLDVAPSLGLGMNFGNKSGLDLPAGGFGADFGVRFWF
jgi:hypothetical protein